MSERGSALVEFAIASTVALTMIFGIVDFGRGLYTYHLVASAARAGSRYAIVHGSACTVTGCPATSNDIQTYVRGLAPGIDPNSLTVATTWPGGCLGGNTNGPGCTVTVTVTYPFKFIVALLPSFRMNMSSASTMVISQ
ncbi:MAG TPA: TadE/TadG family type IV pilus assembly protein [Candidatus Elarobacter sp.]|nr:TadE/TadG family type IV pilus assembly protein [Candidatus Elarobacter sp.]